MKTLGQKVSRKPESAAAKHPTCAAVLGLLDQATGLLRAKLGEEEPTRPGIPKPEVQAMAIGYAFDALNSRSGPFSHPAARDIAMKAFMAGWQSNDQYHKGKREG